MNYYILLIVLIQFSASIAATTYSLFWIKTPGQDISYLGYDYSSISNTAIQNYIIQFMLWFIALMNFVPISLLVTVELVKLT